jgi:NTE family protein
VPEDLEHLLHESIDRGGVHLHGTIDTLDNAKLPKLGWLVRLEALQALESLGGEEEFLRLELDVDRFWTTGRHTAFGGLQGGGSPNDTLPPYERFRLGGLFSFTGFAPGELTGDNFALARAGYLFRFNRLFHVGAMLEAAQVGDEPRDVWEDPLTSATALLVADTFAGPLYFGFGSAGSGHSAAYILFGRKF